MTEKIENFKPQQRNANKHNQRGMGDMTNRKVNRRDFLKVAAAALGALVVPRALTPLDSTIRDREPSVAEIAAQYLDIPPELETALYNRSTLRLDALGIHVDGLNDLDSAAWRDEVLRRYAETL